MQRLSSCRVLYALISLLFLLALPMTARAQDQTVYTDTLQNGWQFWGWATANFSNNSPVRSGSASIKVDAGGYQAIYFHHDAFSTQPYTDLTFYINGGTNGGQPLQVQALVNGTAQTAVAIGTVPANQWVKVTVPLTTLGVANGTMDGFWIQSRVGNTLPTFYVDDVSLTAVPAPTTISLTVNNNQAKQTVDDRIFAVNSAVWDNQFNTQTTIDLLKDSDNRALRFPGGSLSDEYHFKTNTTGTNTWQWATSFDAFANVARQTNAQAFITVNYGTGTPQEAADWVRYSSITKNYGFKLWEVGNENYGTWETDTNTRAHDPYTYANRFKDYYTAMKAADSTIKVGAVIIIGEDDWGNYTDHPTTNPRTLVAHNGWGPVMLGRLKALGVTPDFVSYHKYAQNPGNENDATLLQSSATWASDISNLRQMLSDYMGTAGAGISIVCTENNSVSFNPGKQTTSLVNGLFLADSTGQVLQTECKALVLWDFRNAQETGNNNSASLYGWRQYGDYGIVSPSNEKYPTYQVTKLLRQFARGGDVVVQAGSDYSLLSVYAVRRTNGSLALLVINKSPNLTLTGKVSLTGYTAQASATTYTYGIAQDKAAQTGAGSPDIVQSTLSGIAASGFTSQFAPYSATVVALSPTVAAPVAPMAPSQLTLNTQTATQVSLAWRDNSNNETGFQVECSINGATYKRVTTTAANVTTLVDKGRTTGQRVSYRVRAVNTAGASTYSNLAIGTVR